MKTLSKMISTALIFVAAAAFAQGTPEPKKDEPAAAKAPEGKEGEMAMKPAPEMQEYKSMLGSWKCQGKGTMMGKEMKSTGTYKAAWDMDGYWVAATFEGKAAGMPGSHKGKDYYGYDPAKKEFISFSVDNMGGKSMARSKGWQGDKQEWAGKASMMGQEMDVKWSVTRKGDKEVTIAGSMGTDSYEMTCKK